MATSKPPTSNLKTSSSPKTQPRRTRLRRMLPWIGLALLVGVAVFGGRIMRYATTGAAYGARVACSCHYVGGRGLSDCRKDFEPGMGPVTLSADASEQSVTARVPLLASATATFHKGEGCMLERWEN